jgi:NhaP-type Na+/H+ or K+/H+ antiporter
LDGRVTHALLVFAMLVLAFAATARSLGRVNVTAPIVFVAVGGLTAAVTGSVPLPAGPVKALAELTLALVLFHDAAHVRPRQIRAERGLVVRLLLIGLPLTIAAGYLTARALLPGLPVMFALFVAAALAPTDAGLGAATVLNPVVPVRVRRLLNVESGLNDGLATPVVLFAIAALAGEEGLRAGTSAAEAALEIVLGTAVGAAVGAGGGLLLGWSRRRGLSSAHTRAIGVLVLPIIAFTLAEVVGGNTFVSAFVAGTAMAGAAAWTDEEGSALELTEMLSEPFGFAVWFVFGFAALPLVWSAVGWREVVFAVASLTALRMVPVALALLGTGLRAQTVAFVGWFGPRGLASVVFALIAVETLEADDDLRKVLTAVALTVLLSVVAHGLTADVLAARYGAWVGREQPTAETVTAAEPRPRGWRLASPPRTG